MKKSQKKNHPPTKGVRVRRSAAIAERMRGEWVEQMEELARVAHDLAQLAKERSASDEASGGTFTPTSGDVLFLRRRVVDLRGVCELIKEYT